jgi:hypothetical protein
MLVDGKGETRGLLPGAGRPLPRYIINMLVYM